MKILKCPMRPYEDDSPLPETNFSDCLGDECAWYNKTNNNCAVLSLSIKSSK